MCYNTQSHISNGECCLLQISSSICWCTRSPSLGFPPKLPCNVSRVLDVKDCPLHNVVHDIVLYPKYDPIYHPHCHPEIFQTPMTVKEWVGSTLNSYASVCCGRHSEDLHSRTKFLVQWRHSYFVVCSVLNGKIRQSTMSSKDLEPRN